MAGVRGCAAVVVLLSVVAQMGMCSAAYGGPNQYVLNYGVELSELEQQVPVRDGLVWGFYAQTCATAESIVASSVAAALKSDAGVAAGLVRLIFHDCFVQGCDASILLQLSSGTELDDIPNQTIRASALALVDSIKKQIEAKCPKIVSCADIVVLAAKVAVQQAGGPAFNVPLGRRDSLSFSASTADLPSPRATFAQQSSVFTSKGLDNTDVVALAGAHTLGVAHCGAFNFRLLPTVDPKLNPSYAAYLKTNVCPTLSATGSSGLDFYTPNTFDNQYFKNLPTGGALMESDQNLDQDATAWKLVNKWAGNQTDFFNQFLWSFIKMSQIQTLSGTKGEIRNVCSKTNSGSVSTDPESEGEDIQLVTAESSLEPKFIRTVGGRKADV